MTRPDMDGLRALVVIDAAIERASARHDWMHVAALTRLLLWLVNAGHIPTERTRHARATD